MSIDRDISGLIYTLAMVVLTVVLLVALGNRLGLVGIVIALVVPMFIEIVRSVLKISKRKG